VSEVVEGKFRKKPLESLLNFIANAAGAIWIFIGGRWIWGIVKVVGDQVYVDGKREGIIDDVNDVSADEP